MVNLLFLALPLLLAFIMFKQGFCRAFIFLLNTAFAAYFAVWSAKLLGGMLKEMLPREFEPFLTALAMLAGFIIVFLVLFKVVDQMLTNPDDHPFPKLVNKAGAALLGFFAGFVIISLFLFMLVTTPWKIQAGEYLSAMDEVETTSVNHLLRLTRVVDRLSMQKITAEARESTLRERIYTPPPPPEEEKPPAAAPAAPGAKTPAAGAPGAKTPPAPAPVKK